MAFLGGLIGGLADIGGDLINQQTSENIAQQQAQAAEQLAEQNFKNETGYISNQDQAARDAILGVSTGMGNPYANATQDMRGPQALSGGSFGGGSYSGAQGGAQTQAAQNTPAVLGAPQAAPGGSPPAAGPGSAQPGLAGAPGPNPAYSTNAQGMFNFNGNAGYPTDVSGRYPTLQQAEQAWEQKYGTGPGAGKNGLAAGMTAAPTASGPTIRPPGGGTESSSGLLAGVGGGTIRPQQGGVRGNVM